MYIWGTKLQFLSPSGQKNFIFSEIISFLANKCTFGIPNSSFYPHRVKKNFIFCEILPFLGNKCIFRGTKLQFLSQLGKKKTSFLVKFFPFLGNKCTFGGTKLQFLFPSGQKNFIFSEIFPFLGNKCTFGVPNSSFYPHWVKKTSFLVKFFHL